MKKLVKESIIVEKFTEEDSDPIHDMGIGGHTFETLRPGAIITAKVPRLSLKRNDDGYFTYPGKGIDLPIDYPILVTSVRNYIIAGHKEIKIYKGENDIDELKKKKEELKDGKSLSTYWGTKSRMIIKKNKFNRMFKVIEPGFGN
jgi:hypothetical protein